VSQANRIRDSNLSDGIHISIENLEKLKKIVKHAQIHGLEIIHDIKEKIKKKKIFYF
jgi:hypothetical protein